MVESLTMEIEKLAKDYGSYVDAIVEFAKEHQVDPEDILEMVGENVYQKTSQEFIDKNCVKGVKNESSLSDFF